MNITALYALVFSLSPTIQTPLSPIQFMRILRKKLKRYTLIDYRCAITSGPIKELIPHGSVDIDDEGRIRICLTLSCVGFLPASKYQFTDSLLFQVFEILSHEYVHVAQLKKCRQSPRPYHNPNPTQQYYGTKDEIDAFGLSAALEQHYGAPQVTLQVYRQTFSSSHHLYKRFLKKRWKHSVKYSLPPSLLDDINRASGG
jgi:hypothetical protein